jgi:hypothetical protein
MATVNGVVHAWAVSQKVAKLPLPLLPHQLEVNTLPVPQKCRPVNSTHAAKNVVQPFILSAFII